MLSGFINLNKHSGVSSNKALCILKSVLIRNNIDTKVGHFGTLDPDADGVLPVALGRAARLFDYFIDKRKEYFAIFRFGIATDTLDLSGAVLRTDDAVVIDMRHVTEAASRLTGEIMQLPPDYSAKKIGGRKAYDLARRGERVELAPKKVDVYSISCLEALGQNRFSFRISCGGGTYIRAIARDMASLVGTVGIMEYLRREKSGPFELSDSVTLKELESAADLSSYILPTDYVLRNLPKYCVSLDERTRLLNGAPIYKQDLPDGNFTVYEDGSLIGIGHREDERIRVRTWLL